MRLHALGLVIVLVMVFLPAPAAAVARPNIVLILADDLGYSDVGVQGCRDIPTPQMDSIARSGARFTDVYVNSPMCAPTRAGLLTRRYQQWFGSDDNEGPQPEEAFGIPASARTIAETYRLRFKFSDAPLYSYPIHPKAAP